MQTEVVASLADVAPEEWDRLTGDDDPFVEHAFLRALETSQSVGPGTGWAPAHVVARDAGRLVGALPLYVKSHSYGEYIFDFSWASAAARAGLAYYPKLVSMAPMTPATGQRFLLDPQRPAGPITRALVERALELADDIRAGSLHLLFLTRAERDAVAPLGGLMPRLSSQFHWHNAGYASFDDFLARFRAALRKQVRRERRQVIQAGLDIRTLEGPALGDLEWDALWRFYLDTCGRKGSTPYLREPFFRAIRDDHAHRVVAVMAYRQGTPVAGTLNFQKGKNLYGRYWGSDADYEALHFELCYYRLIERAIEQGLERFEAGAQGVHKLRRGLMPVPIHSMHWIRDAGLRRAVADYLPREALMVQREIAELAHHGPFHRGGE